MSEATIIAVTALLFGWAVLSGRLARSDVTGPLLFVLVGLIGSWASLDFASIDVGTSTVHRVAELTLALVLFADAARLDVAGLRREIGVPARLLLVGLPLTVLAGWGVGELLLGGLPAVLVLLLAASLAPTDAALSATVIADRRVPAAVRRALNVESGLNDGIITPVVTLCLAVAVAEQGTVDVGSAVGEGVVELVIGVAVGAVVGLGGGWALRTGDSRGWIEPGGRRIAVLALALAAFFVAQAAGGNAFIAAFVAGIGFASVARTDRLRRAPELTELGGELAALVVWFIFGATLAAPALESISWSTAGVVMASLTVVRMAPVAVALAGRGGWPTVAFVGWFGPRGLASVVFALLTLESLGEGDAQAALVVDVVALTVLVSVVAHGVSARPLSARFAAWSATVRHPALSGPAAMRTRRVHLHRHSWLPHPVDADDGPASGDDDPPHDGPAAPG